MTSVTSLTHWRDSYRRLVQQINAGHGVAPERLAEVLTACGIGDDEFHHDIREALDRQAEFVAELEHAEAEERSYLALARAA